MLINLELQKWQINFVLMAASSSVVHFSFRCTRMEVRVGVLGGPRGLHGSDSFSSYSASRLALALTQFK